MQGRQQPHKRALASVCAGEYACACVFDACVTGTWLAIELGTTANTSDRKRLTGYAGAIASWRACADAMGFVGMLCALLQGGQAETIGV
eukprot:779507-Pleurochrysis_carterae.AAC.1